jgi:hypothetical protein
MGEALNIERFIKKIKHIHLQVQKTLENNWRNTISRMTNMESRRHLS